MYDRFVYPFYGPYGLLGNILYYIILYYYIIPSGTFGDLWAGLACLRVFCVFFNSFLYHLQRLFVLI
jgi:hypothetical protein